MIQYGIHCRVLCDAAGMLAKNPRDFCFVKPVFSRRKKMRKEVIWIKVNLFETRGSPGILVAGSVR
jgi:hypothetical protein